MTTPICFLRTVFGSALAIFVTAVATVEAATITIASSDFDDGSQGWTWLAADPGITWTDLGGDPGGYIRYDNNVPYGSGATASVYAPASFLGNWSALGVTDLSYQANIFQTGTYAGVGTYRALISGPGGEYRWNGPAPDPSTSWLPLTAPIIESEWAAVSGNWNSLLDDVTQLTIVMAYYTNYKPFEITGIDNVSLHALQVPEPTAAVLLGTVFACLALAGVARRGRKRMYVPPSG